MRKALRVSVLILALTGSVYAGDIPNGVASPPPPEVISSTEVKDGDMPFGRPEAITGAVLNLLQSVLALL